MAATNVETKTKKTKLSKDIKYYIHSIIGIVLMIGFGFLPPFGSVTPIGMKYLGILLGLVYLWSLVGMFWPSLLGLVVLIFSGETGASVCTAAFGNNIIIMCVFAMAIVFAIGQTGVFDYLVNWILNLKMLKGRPWLLSYFLIIGLFAVVALGGEMPLLFIMWEMVYKIADSVGIPRKSRYCAAMIVGLMFALVCGGFAMPYKSAFVFIMGLFYSMTPMATINVVPAMIALLVGSISVLTIYVLLMRFVLRIDLSKLKNADASVMTQELPPMNKRQKFAGCYLCVFLVALVLTGLAPYLGDNVIAQTITRMGTVGMCWLLAAILILIRIDGKPMMDVPKVASLVIWDSVLLMAIAFTLSPMLTGEGTGVSEWVMSLVNPILGGHSAYVFTILLFVITLVLTNVANNTVVMILMITVIAPFSAILDLNLPAMAILMCLMSQTAFMLPASSIYGALIYSQSGEVATKDIMLCAFMAMIASTLAMVLVILPLGNILF